VLTPAPENYEGLCEMQCRNPNVLDVSCGGTMNSYTVYVLKGKQGECHTLGHRLQQQLFAVPCIAWKQ
jgi:hypothetical protein